jgi:hypothetical protein
MKQDSGQMCPLCDEQLSTPMRLEICGDCFQDLGTAGSISLQTTGEFSAMTPGGARRMVAGGRPRSFTGDGSITCTWCGKGRDQVKKILSGKAAHLCNECVALCADILESEVGPDWRQ